MKKTLLALVAVAALGVGGAAQAADVGIRHAPVEKPNMLLFNPGDLLGGIVSFEYERALETWFGLSAGLSVQSFRGAFTPAGTSSYVALGPEIGARFHFIQAAPGGLWLGPYVGGAYIAARDDGAVSRAFGWNLGAALGYNFIIARSFVFQIGAGGGFHDYGNNLVWAPRLRLGLGGVF